MKNMVELSSMQRQLLSEAEQFANGPEEKFVVAIAAGEIAARDLTDEQLLAFLQLANLLYRAGEPLISDHRYDFTFLAELRRRRPDHPYLHQVEPEPPAMKTVALPTRMLSTEKAYDFESVERWAKRVGKAAEECGVEFATLVFRATPKLDGYAAYDDGTTLYTRGDGRRGTDITRAFTRGLQVADGGARGLGAGEIVVSRSYFAKNLSQFFDNSRNFQASLIKEKELEAPAAAAIEQGAAVFYPFVLLPAWQGTWYQLADDFAQIVDSLWGQLDYDIDGIIIEIIDESLKEYMGATRHHHRWQLAFKRNTETAEVRVERVVAQTSRSGRVNPVAEVEPTRLSGARICRASAHHYRMVLDKGIGPGAVIQLSRSGEVIPKIEEVIEPVKPELPERCPSCGASLVWENDYLFCVDNMHCPAQLTHSIEHFFKTLGNVDGFGPSSINKLYTAGIRSLPEIYRLTITDFENFGFGPKQAENMVGQLQRSRTEPVEDWRFLAAFGVFRLGMGNCERLLSVYPLDKVFALTETEIITIKGFSDKSATGMVSGLRGVRDLFSEMYVLGFNLLPTPLVTEATGEDSALGPLHDKVLVFTGTMRHGSREEMKRQAKDLGARVGSSITSKTDMLICGEKVGASKMAKAEKLGVSTLTEEQYMALIGRPI